MFLSWRTTFFLKPKLACWKSLKRANFQMNTPMKSKRFMDTRWNQPLSLWNQTKMEKNNIFSFLEDLSPPRQGNVPNVARHRRELWAQRPGLKLLAMWCPRSIAKLVHITLISLGLMVDISIVNGIINQLITGGHHLVWMILLFQSTTRFFSDMLPSGKLTVGPWK